MKMHPFPLTTSGTASAAAAAAHKDCRANRWLAAITGLPVPATLPLLETRWSQRRAGSPLWRVIVAQKAAPTHPRPSARRAARHPA